VPECIREATSEYRKETDPIMGFLNECCVIGEGEEIKAGHLYEAFRKWAGSDSKHLSQTAFGRRMSLKFIKKEKASGYYYQGIRLKGVRMVGSRITGITINPEDLEEDND
jgi:putative DNA primase/helicase